MPGNRRILQTLGAASGAARGIIHPARDAYAQPLGELHSWISFLMKTLLLIIALGMSVSAAAQETNTSGVLAELACKGSKRATSYDAFVESIKKGERGDGVHQPWMDVMRRLGIK